jgi:serine/threonine protein kinase
MILRNPERPGIRYKIGKELGAGGFGTAYHAIRKIKGEPDAEVCVKVSRDLDGWLTEVHFGKLLQHQPRVIQLYDYFVMPGANTGTEYVLVSELAKGDLESLMEANPDFCYSPKRALSEVAALLKTMAMLHSISSVHRDLTPRNIFLAHDGKLKLADFGIARVLLPGKKASNNTANWWFAPKAFEGRPKDDVFFMGQLLAKLVTGNAETPALRMKDLVLKSGAPLEDKLVLIVLQRSIGSKKSRYEDAAEMLLAIEGDGVTQFGGIRSLRNKRVIFTGPLTLRRDDAKLLAIQGGARVLEEVSKSLDVVVVGGVSPHYLKGRKGRKLLEIERLNKLGAGIKVIGEAEFLQLVRPK